VASFKSFIHERVADEDFDSGFSLVRTTRPVDSPPTLEKPENSSEIELEIDIIPLKQFVGSLGKEQNEIALKIANQAKYLYWR